MNRTIKNGLVAVALGSVLVLAACDNTSDGPTANFNTPAQPSALTLSALVNMLVTTQNSDTTKPTEINGLAFDSNLDDLALPNSDPNYSGLVGT